jgi:hypothetical protein
MAAILNYGGYGYILNLNKSKNFPQWTFHLLTKI